MPNAKYEKPASQVDLEERQKKDYVPGSVIQAGVDPVLSENGYVGVDPIYQNAANDTELPVQADKGPESKVFEEFLSDDVEYPSPSQGGSEDADEYEDSSGSQGATSPPGGTFSTPTAPTA